MALPASTANVCLSAPALERPQGDLGHVPVHLPETDVSDQPQQATICHESMNEEGLYFEEDCLRKVEEEDHESDSCCLMCTE
jgi:hypothetical protein